MELAKAEEKKQKKIRERSGSIHQSIDHQSNEQYIYNGSIVQLIHFDQ